jgi:hypothetical protein
MFLIFHGWYYTALGCYRMCLNNQIDESKHKGYCPIPCNEYTQSELTSIGTFMFDYFSDNVRNGLLKPCTLFAPGEVQTWIYNGWVLTCFLPYIHTCVNVFVIVVATTEIILWITLSYRVCTFFIGIRNDDILLRVKVDIPVHEKTRYIVKRKNKVNGKRGKYVIKDYDDEDDDDDNDDHAGDRNN